MSHPFTLEYMREGEMDSAELNVDDAKPKNNEEQLIACESQTKARSSRRISPNNPVIDGCHTHPSGEHLGVLEKIKQNERISSLMMIRMTVRRRMAMFAQEVSIVGLSNLVKPSNNKIGSIIRKVIWTMLLLFGVGFMVYQIYDRISYYQTYPTIVNYRVAYNRSLRFPTVTICSEFLISKKALSSLGLLAQSISANRYPPLMDIGFDEVQRENLSQFNLDWEFCYDYTGFKTADTLLECSFGNLPCHSRDAIKEIKSDLGFCMSFNPETMNYVTTQPGANHGLRLVLWVNQSDCYLTASPGVGFRVVLHDPSDQPVVQMTGFRVGTGVSTSVAFSLRNVSMLPSPYGDCQGGNYTYQKCMTKCWMDLMLSQCNCRVLNCKAPGAKVCSPDQYFYCVTKTSQWFISSGASSKCDCPLQCHQPTYPFSISTSPLSQHFLNYMSRRSQFKGRNLTMSKLSKELVYLDIFYSQLSYVDFQMTPAYDILTLVCDIGGALGLILGGTLLTIVEVLQCFV